jgi:bacterioferritin-associated ferredoxin
VKDTNIICYCNYVTVYDVKEYISVYPQINTSQLKNILRIGSRCGCCNKDGCPTIDINYNNVLENLGYENTES